MRVNKNHLKKRRYKVRKNNLFGMKAILLFKTIKKIAKIISLRKILKIIQIKIHKNYKTNNFKVLVKKIKLIVKIFIKMIILIPNQYQKLNESIMKYIYYFIYK